MIHLIDKDALVVEIKRRISLLKANESGVFHTFASEMIIIEYENMLSFLNTLKVKDLYEQCYDSIKAGIQAHAKTYSFNIESLLFNQLTKEQQVLWRKEIEQACISGGEVGVELARDIRYKENVEVKEVDLDEEIKNIQRKYHTIDFYEGYPATIYSNDIEYIAKYFFELGLA